SMTRNSSPACARPSMPRPAPEARSTIGRGPTGLPRWTRPWIPLPTSPRGRAPALRSSSPRAPWIGSSAPWPSSTIRMAIAAACCIAREIHLNAARLVRPPGVQLARELFAREMKDRYDAFDRSVALYADVLGEEGLAEYRRLASKAWDKLPGRGEDGAS